MRWPTSVVLILAAGAALAPHQEASSQTTERGAEVGAFLFSYRPAAGARTAFEEGYRRHLAWHAAAGDSLTWFGWEILAGPRLGEFVDGVFGIPFRTLDQRVDPAGDAEDLAANVMPHATPTTRELLRGRPDLGTTDPLSAGEPAPLVQVVRYRTGPGGHGPLERALAGLRDAAEPRELHPYTVYESVAGSEPAFVVLIWRAGLATFDRHDRDPQAALRRHLTGDAGAVDVTTELWRYRPDLTYHGSSDRVER